MSAELVLQEVAQEVSRAVAKWEPLNSPHEGYAVILEELEELWEHVRADTARGAEARTEAVHVAAMAVRYAAELTPPPIASST